MSADCSQCAALCCMALAFDKGARFALDKPAGTPCPNLGHHLCAIHDQLENRGFSGCAAYDCLGAGQRVTQELFAGDSWQDRPELTRPMIDAFAHMRLLHSLWELLETALGLPLSEAERTEARAHIAAIRAPLNRDTIADRATGALQTEVHLFLRGLERHVTGRAPVTLPPPPAPRR